MPDTPKIIKVEFINNSASKTIIHWKNSTPSAKYDFEAKYKIKSDPEVNWTLVSSRFAAELMFTVLVLFLFPDLYVAMLVPRAISELR